MKPVPAMELAVSRSSHRRDRVRTGRCYCRASASHLAVCRASLSASVTGDTNSRVIIYFIKKFKKFKKKNCIFFFFFV